MPRRTKRDQRIIDHALAIIARFGSTYLLMGTDTDVIREAKAILRLLGYSSKEKKNGNK
tara:strand:+ start:221 stop:397 length:177 start_codon:yes stop_codon:yes gene_type:complete